MNLAIEADIVGPNLPEEADRVEQLLVEFRAVQQRIHDLNQVQYSTVQYSTVQIEHLDTRAFLQCVLR